MKEKARGESDKPRFPASDKLRFPIAEFAALAGISVQHIYRRSAEGDITLIRDGGKTFVTAEEARRYIEKDMPSGRSRTGKDLVKQRWSAQGRP